jgi:menaquinone-dependent protoporphyrinogen oxidase
MAGVSVLVGYASAYGSTKGIAKEIGDRLTQAGLQVEVRPIDEIEEVDTYDAVVLGSAIHNRAWLPQAAVFVPTHSADLASRPVWLFSVSSVGDTSSFFGPRVARCMRRMRKEPKEIAGFRRAIRPRGHRNFAGAIERAHWNLAGNLFLKALRGSYGDHRDWGDVDTWVDEIGRQLRAAPEATSG